MRYTCKNPLGKSGACHVIGAIGARLLLLLLMTTMMMTTMIMMTSLCALPAWAVPKVTIISPETCNETIQEGEAVAFTFKAEETDPHAVVPGRGPLILLAAGDPDETSNPTWPATRHMIQTVYLHFNKDLGYSHEDICLIMGGDFDLGEDGTKEPDLIDHSDMTEGAVVQKITSFGKSSRVTGDTLYLWIMGHGAPDPDSGGGRVILSQNNSACLGVDKLHNALTDIEIARSGTYSRIVAIIDTCYAGTFHETLGQGNHRVVISGADNEFSLLEGEGERSFSVRLIKLLTGMGGQQGITDKMSLGKAFKHVKMAMVGESIEVNPRIDVNGDGTPNLREAKDLETFYVGGDLKSQYQPPDIVSRTPGGRITGETLDLDLLVRSATQIESAWVSLLKPGYDPSALSSYLSGQSDSYEDPVLRFIMDPQTGDDLSSDEYRFSSTLYHLTDQGRYNVTFFAKDSEGVEISSSTQYFRKGDAPYLRVATDASLYAVHEPTGFELALGGQGSVDFYSVVVFPDGAMHGVILDNTGFHLTPALDLSNNSSNTTIPLLVSNFSLPELPLSPIFFLSGSSANANGPALDQEGVYAWYMAVTEPGGGLGALVGYDVCYFYRESVSALSVQRDRYAASLPDIISGPGVSEESPGNSLFSPLGAAGDQFQYAWYLEGYAAEPDWQPWSGFRTTSEEKAYFDLTPGPYTFHVKARSKSNAVSAEVKCPFSIVAGAAPDPDEPVTPASFAVTPDSVTVGTGEVSQLSAKVSMSDGTPVDVTDIPDCRWESDTPGVAAAGTGGIVVGVSKGSATITVRYLEFEATVKITVTQTGSDPDNPGGSGVDKLTLDRPAVTLKSRGATIKLSATAAMKDGTQQQVTSGLGGVAWESSDPLVAVVDSNGLVTVTAVDQVSGTADISCSYGGQRAICTVTVAIPYITGIRLAPADGLHFTSSGASAQVTAYGIYSDGPEENLSGMTVSWSVDDPLLAVVDSNGTVSCTGEGDGGVGRTNLTATYAGVSASIPVTAEFPHPALWVEHAELSSSAVSGSSGDSLQMWLANSGSGTLNFQVTESLSWLEVSPMGGSDAGGDEAGVQLTFSFTAVDMEPGPYSGLVTISASSNTAAGVGSSPHNINVSFEVTAPDPVDPGPIDPGPSGESFTNSLGMSFNEIPAGTFMMGSPEDEPDRGSYEGPQHQVTLTQAYYMQTTEVTNAQFVQFLNSVGVRSSSDPWFDTYDEDDDSHIEGTTGNFYVQAGYENHPVIEVSWYGAQAFADWLSSQTEDRYSLPTEAQWEYAARAGTTTPFAFGECLSTDQANYNGNYPYEGCPSGEYRSTTVPVASFVPNAWGLYDMHGNVWEWCSDWFNSDYYTNSPSANPQGPSEGSFRVLRGGSWNYDARYCRSAYRSGILPDNRNYGIGFRLACSPGQ